MLDDITPCRDIIDTVLLERQCLHVLTPCFRDTQAWTRKCRDCDGRQCTRWICVVSSTYRTQTTHIHTQSHSYQRITMFSRVQYSCVVYRKTRLAVDMKFPIHIHIHIHRFSVDIHGYIHIHRCLSCMHVSTLCLKKGPPLNSL